MSPATGQTDPSSSKRSRRSDQPSGLGFEVSKARTISSSSIAMTSAHRL
jgi:hypothetical protein